MWGPANSVIPPPSSPTESSISSSDLDTESTGSFFHDRSTTLGTLMGVNFPAVTFRAPPQHLGDTHLTAAAAASLPPGSASANNKKKKKKTIPAAIVERRRRGWWRLCRDGGSKPASLGDFLEVERRFGDGGLAAFHNDAAVAELEGVMVEQPTNSAFDGRILFADGRVLPPAGAVGGGTSAGVALFRFPVSLTGICSGGGP